MKHAALALVPFFTIASAAVLLSARPMPQSDAPRALAAPVLVVVELFTSEGCSSCPAADAALRELETTQSLKGVEVIALGQHVDYWNRLGWKDPFSSSAFTQRQRVYAQQLGGSVYTPQVIVNGTYEFVGSRRQELAEAIGRAAKAPRATVRATRVTPTTLNVQVAHLPAGTKPTEVTLVITETGLSSQVGRGENAGRRLHHAAVVRELRVLGTVAANGTFATAVPLRLAAAWQAQNLRAVVLVQEKESRHIVGVASLALGIHAQTARRY